MLLIEILFACSKDYIPSLSLLQQFNFVSRSDYLRTRSKTTGRLDGQVQLNRSTNGVSATFPFLKNDYLNVKISGLIRLVRSRSHKYFSFLCPHSRVGKQSGKWKAPESVVQGCDAFPCKNIGWRGTSKAGTALWTCDRYVWISWNSI